MDKIMFIASNYPPRIGGPASTVPQIAKELSKKFELTVVAFQEKNVPKHEKKEFELFRAPSFYYFGFSNPLSVIIRTILLSLYTRGILSKKKSKIIHAYDAHISLIAALFCKYTSLRKVVTITKYAGDTILEFSNLNTLEDSSIEQIIANPGMKKKILILIQKFLFNRSDYIHAHNDYQKMILKKLYKIPENKILSLSNPIDTKKFYTKKRKRNSGAVKLLVAVRLVPWKCPEIVIRAMKNISKKFPKIKLDIIGDGPAEYKKILKDLAKESKDRITFKGKIPNEKMPSNYQKSDILIQASSYEPFSNTVLESLSCGTPVLASDVGGNLKLISNGTNGNLFKVNDQNDFEKKLLKTILMLDRFDPKKVTNTIKQYELGKVCDDFANAYKKILKK